MDTRGRGLQIMWAVAVVGRQPLCLALTSQQGQKRINLTRNYKLRISAATISSASPFSGRISARLSPGDPDLLVEVGSMATSKPRSCTNLDKLRSSDLIATFWGSRLAARVKHLCCGQQDTAEKRNQLHRR